MNVVYDCHSSQVMWYADRGYCFRRGDDAFLMWDGYFCDLMDSMWRVYGWEFDPDDPGRPNLGQVPLLRVWNEQAWIGTDGPLPITHLPATARAFRDAIAELQRVGSRFAESPVHGEALVAFLEEAVATGLSVSVEEYW